MVCSATLIRGFQLCEMNLLGLGHAELLHTVLIIKSCQINVLDYNAWVILLYMLMLKR